MAPSLTQAGITGLVQKLEIPQSMGRNGHNSPPRFQNSVKKKKKIVLTQGQNKTETKKIRFINFLLFYYALEMSPEWNHLLKIYSS